MGLADKLVISNGSFATSVLFREFVAVQIMAGLGSVPKPPEQTEADWQHILAGRAIARTDVLIAELEKTNG
jgi:hypothetical protein